MSQRPVLDILHTDRLILRPARTDDAVIYRQLWTERDPRVPPHRRIDDRGQPTVDDLAARIRAQSVESGPHLLTVVRTDVGDVIGYCGLTVDEERPSNEPGLAYELLRSAQGFGYATEAGLAVVRWAKQSGYRRLWATVWDWNHASHRVLEKLQFREVDPGLSGSADDHQLVTVREL